jgi:drug/metabolite transporter (DMT)-like permease
MGWILVSALSFGIMPVFAHVAYRAGTSPATLLSVRFLTASVCMLPLLWWRRDELPARKYLVALLLLGGVGFTAEALTFFYALQHAAAGVVALLLYLYPTLVALFSAWLFKERLGAPQYVAITLALVGTVLTVDPTGSSKPLGIALGILSAFIYAVFVLGSSRVNRHVSPAISTALIVVSAGVALTLIALVQGPRPPTTATGWAAACAMGVISTIVAILTFFLGAARIGATRAATIATIEPLFTTVFAALFLDEKVRPIQLAGGALILGAVVILLKPPTQGRWAPARPPTSAARGPT